MRPSGGKTETTTYATGLVNSEHRLHNEMLLTNAAVLAAPVHDAEASVYTLKNDIRESRSPLAALQFQQRSATAALEPSTRENRPFNAGYRTHPCTQPPGTGIVATMPPLQARPHPTSDSANVSQPHATLDTRLSLVPSVDLTTTV